MGKLRVGLIFGGRSGEHEVSLRSARAVIQALDGERYEVIPIAIAKDGRWLPPAESWRMLPSASIPSTPHSSPERDAVTIIGDLNWQGLVHLGEDGTRVERLDVVFPVLHGTYGEDGTIQGLLEMANIPYVGCGVLASACGMDKVAMKSLFRAVGLPICRYLWFLRAEWETKPSEVIKRIEHEIGFPCFVKPANLGSSVGVTRATDRASLEAALTEAALYDRKIVVEEALDVREIECAVLGNEDPQASLPGEYVVLDRRAEFLDYTEKYGQTGHVEFVTPAPVAAELVREIQQMACRAFRAIDGAGLARVDFFLRRDTDELLINEINTMPGLTDVSGYPKMWAASGLDFPQLLDRLIELALERHRDKARNRTSLAH
ncbi:D-alanine--D-alanine ligase family protein [Pyrinomonas methylaliphatogenes]|uniref:D-alanine--D-alanine ligase n=1 Tax=Pyrinomonas methylaliphatogenes TaxID=454194 RepID=A0A0B6WYG3_9BACT|nr:D-alanine--D-alanine ligase family protein [Pyrinomonas methylaliphatogenes]CDM65344.1 D-alanine--D-alanine ligase [Pyrinomonas methylaliphatogenes]